MSPWEFVLLVFAVYRVTMLLTIERISISLRKHYLFRCAWCMSVWVAAIGVLASWWRPEQARWCIAAIAASGVVVMGLDLIHKVAPGAFAAPEDPVVKELNTLRQSVGLSLELQQMMVKETVKLGRELTSSEEGELKKRLEYTVRERVANAQR